MVLQAVGALEQREAELRRTRHEQGRASKVALTKLADMPKVRMRFASSMLDTKLLPLTA